MSYNEPFPTPEEDINVLPEETKTEAEFPDSPIEAEVVEQPEEKSNE